MSLTTGISPDKPLRSMDGLALANALKRRWPALVYQVQTDGRSLHVTTGLPSFERLLSLHWSTFADGAHCQFGSGARWCSLFGEVEDGLAEVVQQLRERLREVG